MLRLFLLGLLFLPWVYPDPLSAQQVQPGRNTYIIRGHPQSIDFYPGLGPVVTSRPKVLYAPGDVGMFGFGATIAKTISSWGYDVYGLDTRRYLAGFTANDPLQKTQVAADFGQIAGWMSHGTDEKVDLVGWSEGAGLCLLAATDEQNKKHFAGFISLGMTENNALEWHWSDLLGSVFGMASSGPSFSSAAYLPKVAPLPLLMIQSSGDQFVSNETALGLFSRSLDPKRFLLIEAKNHRFDGNQDKLFQSIREGLEWIRQTSVLKAPTTH
jgi:pimeloyl-ACP methyl ester carboxylesterase